MRSVKRRELPELIHADDVMERKEFSFIIDYRSSYLLCADTSPSYRLRWNHKFDGIRQTQVHTKHRRNIVLVTGSSHINMYCRKNRCALS